MLFVGSSSIKNWTPTLATDFPHIPVIDRGFGGSQLADSTRFADRIIVPYHPDVVVLYAGDNDINDGRSADQVIDDFKQFVARVRKDLPHTAIVYITIKPSTSRWKLWPQMHAANEGIAAFAKTQKDVRVVDVASRMLDAKGKPRAELLLDDGLHMRPAGYAIWIDALKPVLAEYGFRSVTSTFRADICRAFSFAVESRWRTRFCDRAHQNCALRSDRALYRILNSANRRLCGSRSAESR